MDSLLGDTEVDQDMAAVEEGTCLVTEGDKLAVGRGNLEEAADTAEDSPWEVVAWAFKAGTSFDQGSTIDCELPYALVLHEAAALAAAFRVPSERHFATEVELQD